MRRRSTIYWWSRKYKQLRVLTREQQLKYWLRRINWLAATARLCGYPVNFNMLMASPKTQRPRCWLTGWCRILLGWKLMKLSKRRRRRMHHNGKKCGDVCRPVQRLAGLLDGSDLNGCLVQLLLCECDLKCGDVSCNESYQNLKENVKT